MMMCDVYHKNNVMADDSV